jgi:hypothetical protein
MPELFSSYKDSPKVPRGWVPRQQPGALIKVPIKNELLKRQLQELLPGKWVKVYHYGSDGSEVHYCQHASGTVFDVEYHAKLRS